MRLTSELRERYSRMLALRDFSEEDMEHIMNTTVTVAGSGGLGSPILRLVSAIGFGRVRVIDRDIVELSNIQRQTVFNTEDIGKPKAEAAVENLRKMNPAVEYEALCMSIESRNAIDLLKGSDIVIDGLDTFQARRHVNRAILKLGIPYIFAGAVEYYANITTIVPGKTGCLHCLIGDAKDNPEYTCAVVGVTPTLLALVAAIQVQEAIQIATGREPILVNKLMTIDMASLSFDRFEIERSITCPICSNIEAEVEESNDISVHMLCSGSFNVSPTHIMNLDLDEIQRKIEAKYNIKRTQKLLIVKIRKGVKMTLMSSGTAVIRGVNSVDEARDLYQEIVN